MDDRLHFCKAETNFDHFHSVWIRMIIRPPPEREIFCTYRGSVASSLLLMFSPLLNDEANAYDVGVRGYLKSSSSFSSFLLALKPFFDSSWLTTSWSFTEYKKKKTKKKKSKQTIMHLTDLISFKDISKTVSR